MAFVGLFFFLFDNSFTFQCIRSILRCLSNFSISSHYSFYHISQALFYVARHSQLLIMVPVSDTTVRSSRFQVQTLRARPGYAYSVTAPIFVIVI